ncbi:MAG: hypothetical protein KDA61_15955, partial [Planctomycetales bacterium]|nr:hypothetical protein [Planctomycetales bacterium]
MVEIASNLNPRRLGLAAWTCVMLSVVAACVGSGQAEAATYTWNGGGFGSWDTPSSWLPATGLPNGVADVARIVPGASSPTIVLLNSSVTVRELELDTAAFIELQGTGALTFDGGSLDADIVATQGSHLISTSVTLAAPTQIDVAAGALVDVLGPLDLAGLEHVKAGDGQLRIDGSATSAAGSLSGRGGVIGGAGTLGGSLKNESSEI